jgi:hypothetical protein
MPRLLTRTDRWDAVLDPDTAERLLDGRLPVDDAPPDGRALARLIEMTGAAPTERELSRQSEAVAVLAAAIRRSSVDAPRPRSSRSKPRIMQLAAASTVGVMTLFGGLAAANALPGAAQSVASDILQNVGVSVPSPDSHADTHPASRGQSGSRTSASTSSSNSSSSSSHGQGSTISSLAHTTTAPGVQKGAGISSAASGGQSQADQDPQPTTSPDAPAGTSPAADPLVPPVSTPGGPPAGKPVGPPAGTPVGPPAGKPVGPPAGKPVGPPAGTPVGPPAGKPVGPPAGKPVGPPDSVPPVSVPGH